MNTALAVKAIKDKPPDTPFPEEQPIGAHYTARSLPSLLVPGCGVLETGREGRRRHTAQC
ncbi:unnamed protein product [Staurois parvus]|uniref:Uncharacterized protein n=1 Tax=Staurois parvus TaxID=386267 RepID=A0ABN9D9F5_9NEOB|nr:unnamed protein product [Staurois parvus]